MPAINIVTCLSVLLVAITSGCAARRSIDNLDELEPGHAIVFGKLLVRYNHSKITDKADFFLRDQARDEVLWMRQDAAGYFFAPLLPGRYLFYSVHATPSSSAGVQGWQFEPGQGVFMVADPSKAHYIGTVQIEMAGPNVDGLQTAATMGLLVAAIATAGEPDVQEHTCLWIDDERAAATEAFRARFGRTPDLHTSIAQAPTPRSDLCPEAIYRKRGPE